MGKRIRRRKFLTGAIGVAVATVTSGPRVIAEENTSNMAASEEELKNALLAAKAGDTVWLMPGASIASLSLDDIMFERIVTIDTPDRNRDNFPTINKIALKRCRNLSFAHIRLREVVTEATVGWEQCVSIQNCVNISFDSCEFEGAAAPADNDKQQLYAGTGVGRALEIIEADGISISNNNFSWWSECLSIGNCRDVTIDNNTMLYTSNNGVLVIGGSGYKITRNKIGDFRVSEKSGLHPDAIQFGTPGLKVPVVDILIDGNDIYTGDLGNQNMQSIFGRNEAVDQENGGKGMFYRNITITNNKIRAQQLHGISWGEAENIRIDSNDVQPWGPKPWPRDPVRRPLIDLARASVGVSIQNNIGKLLEQMPHWNVRKNKNPYM